MQAVIFVGNDQLNVQGVDYFYPAVKVGGITLIKRAVLSVQIARADKVLILAPQAKSIELMLKGDEQIKIPVRVQETDSPFASGATVLAEHREALEERFWLVTLDRIVNPACFSKTEYDEEFFADIFFDKMGQKTGTYLFNKAGLENLETIIKENLRPMSIDELAVYLTRKKKTRSFPLVNALMHPIRSPMDIQAATAKLLNALRKPLGRNADGLTAYYLNRHISLWMTKRLIKTEITPNQTTVVALLVGLFAAYLASTGSYFLMLLGGVMLQLSSVLDGVDGEIARIKLKMSFSGEWFDSICDDITNIAFMAGLGYGVAAKTGNGAYATLALIGAIAGAALVVALYRELYIRGIASHNHYQWGFEGNKKLEGLMARLQPVFVAFSYLAKRDSYTFLLMLLLLFNMPKLSFFIMLFGILAIFSAYYGGKLYALVNGKQTKK